MKKITTLQALTIIIIVLFTVSVNAQITKGNWMVGGSGSFSYSKTDSKNSNSGGTNINYVSKGIYSISLEPNIGYFFLDRLAIGTKISYINGFVEGSKLDSEGMNLSFGPYARYYIFKDKNLINLFVEPSYYKFFSKGLGNSSGYGLKSGLVIFLNSSVGFESSIAYGKSSSKNADSYNVFLGFGLQIHLEKDK